MIKSILSSPKGFGSGHTALIAGLPGSRRSEAKPVDLGNSGIDGAWPTTVVLLRKEERT